MSCVQDATTATHTRLVTELIKAGKYNWQAFGGGDGPGAGVTQHTCIDFMRKWCSPEMQKLPMMMSAGDAGNQTVAAFLIARPPIAFLGYGWESDDKNWNDVFLLQAGTPMGLCKEESAGMFSREWSNGKADLDCNKWTSKLPFPSLT